jgi:hemerythrin-like domain-containing protein
MTKKPIKRNKNIVPLSKDHHHGLLLCWKIRQGLKMNIELERIKNYITFFWQNYLVQHFTQEEELLFSKIEGQICNRVKDEHEIIRLLIAGFNTRDKDNRDCYNRFANLLEQHIRFEERVLFPYLEAHISRVDLENVGKELEKNEPHCELYKDEFWLERKISVTA